MEGILRPSSEILATLSCVAHSSVCSSAQMPMVSWSQRMLEHTVGGEWGRPSVYLSIKKSSSVLGEGFFGGMVVWGLPMLL